MSRSHFVSETVKVVSTQENKKEGFKFWSYSINAYEKGLIHLNKIVEYIQNNSIKDFLV